VTIAHLKSREAPKSVRSSMETLLFSRSEVEQWRVPEFQRPIRVNAKVMALSEEIRQNGGILPGILTLGRLPGDKTNYLVDGQHRVEAFKISEMPEFIADVRICQFDTMAEMADEFVELNSRLVNMRPDDILRSLEQSMPALARITDNCEFVSYGQVRRGNTGSALVSMSALLRAWHMSAGETPNQNAPSAPVLASLIDNNEADKIIAFMQIARGAWGTDPENYRLWGTINLTICMWLWRRLVLDTQRGGTGTGKAGAGYAKVIVLTPTQFGKCLMAVSANSQYVDWLVGRSWTERDRSPCYMRLKGIFTQRLQEEFKDRRVMLPAPAWASNRGT
jgi:hypothetical protein